RAVEKMLAKQGIILKVSERAKNLLADLGYDPQFGARPMKRVLQKEVVNEISKHILAGEFGAGDTIYVHADYVGLTFKKEPWKSSGEDVEDLIGNVAEN
ncbi:MAG: hypothetical protein AAGI49_07550, partial [Bacteroidota bacterium]